MAATPLAAAEAATITGTTLTKNATNVGDGVTIANSGAQKIIVMNDSGGTLTFTATTTQVVESTLAVDDRAYSIPDGDWVFIGAFNPGIYSATVTLNAFSTATNVTILVLG